MLRTPADLRNILIGACFQMANCCLDRTELDYFEETELILVRALGSDGNLLGLLHLKSDKYERRNYGK